MKLAIDTTNNNLCYALASMNNDIIFYENIYPCNDVAEILAPKILDMLQKYSVTIHDIQHIISVTGPGGFSGVRIGTAFVTGFTVHTKIKNIGITSLQALAFSVIKPQHNAIIIACLNARRESVYVSIFNHDYQRLTDDKVIDISEISDFLRPFEHSKFYLAGHGANIIKPFLNDALMLDTIHYSLAQEFIKRTDITTELYNNQPIYLRNPDAVLPKNNNLNPSKI